MNLTITVYAHYPQGYNGTIINDKVLDYMKKNYPLENDEIEIKSDTVIKTSPHNESEMIIVTVNGQMLMDKQIKFINLKFKKFLIEYFCGKITEIVIQCE